jgi:hypothetical protein
VSEIDTSTEAVEAMLRALSEDNWSFAKVMQIGPLLRALAAERDRLVRANASLIEDTVLMGLARDDARRSAFEQAAKEVENALCDVSVDADLFMQVRDHMAGLIRSLAEKEPQK